MITEEHNFFKKTFPKKYRAPKVSKDDLKKKILCAQVIYLIQGHFTINLYASLTTSNTHSHYANRGNSANQVLFYTEPLKSHKVIFILWDFSGSIEKSVRWSQPLSK